MVRDREVGLRSVCVTLNESEFIVFDRFHHKAHDEALSDVLRLQKLVESARTRAVTIGHDYALACLALENGSGTSVARDEARKSREAAHAHLRACIATLDAAKKRLRRAKHIGQARLQTAHDWENAVRIAQDRARIAREFETLAAGLSAKFREILAATNQLHYALPDTPDASAALVQEQIVERLASATLIRHGLAVCMQESTASMPGLRESIDASVDVVGRWAARKPPLANR